MSDKLFRISTPTIKYTIDDEFDMSRVASSRFIICNMGNKNRVVKENPRIEDMSFRVDLTQEETKKLNAGTICAQVHILLNNHKVIWTDIAKTTMNGVLGEDMFDVPDYSADTGEYEIEFHGEVSDYDVPLHGHLDVTLEGSVVIPNPEGEATDDLTKVEIDGEIFLVKDSTIHDWARAEEKPTYTKAEVGLDNVDNTSDLEKPISNDTQTALNSKADSSSVYTRYETDNLLSDIVDENIDATILEQNVDSSVRIAGSASGGASWNNPILTIPSGSTGIGSNVYARVNIPYEYSDVTDLIGVIEYDCSPEVAKNIKKQTFETLSSEVIILNDKKCVIRFTPDLTKTYTAVGITISIAETYSSDQTISVTKVGIYPFEASNFLKSIIDKQAEEFANNYDVIKLGFSNPSSLVWKRGSYDASTGVYSDHSKRICTNDYLPTDIVRIVAKNNFHIAVFVYDSTNNSYVGLWVDTLNNVSTSGAFVFYEDISIASIYALNSNYRVKIMATDYNTAVNPSYSSNIYCLSANNIIRSLGLSKMFTFGDSYTMMQRWQKYVCSECGISYYSLNALVGGTCVERFGYITNCPSSADIVTVWYGTNDWATNVQIGTIDDPVATYGTVASTFISAMKYIMEWLSTNRTVKVFLITHTQRFDDDAIALGQANGYDGEFPKNNNGDTLKDFADAIKEVGQNYGVPVCDLQSIAGINKDTYSRYYDTDKLHPSYNGGKYLGKIIAKIINSLG